MPQRIKPQAKPQSLATVIRYSPAIHIPVSTGLARMWLYMTAINHSTVDGLIAYVIYLTSKTGAETTIHKSAPLKPQGASEVVVDMRQLSPRLLRVTAVLPSPGVLPSLYLLSQEALGQAYSICSWISPAQFS